MSNEMGFAAPLMLCVAPWPKHAVHISTKFESHQKPKMNKIFTDLAIGRRHRDETLPTFVSVLAHLE